MTDDHIIERTDTPSAGRYAIDLGDGYQAEMTYVWRGGIMVVNHTGVPRPFEGRGIALKLVKRAVEDARREGFRIDPLCPYVDVQFRRHPDWSDLRAVRAVADQVDTT